MPEPELIPLHQKPDKVYTRSFQGRFRNLRRVGGALLLLLYFATVWLEIDGRPAVLFDLPESKFHIFTATFWPQDFILLSWLLIICAFGLFTMTVFAGRIWCGYSCPQSVFTWMFMWAEKVTEGDRHQRIRHDKEGFSEALFGKKAAKHAIWLMISLATAVTFVGYFVPIRSLTADLLQWHISIWPLFWILFFTLATYINAGWLREMVCLHMCPYARFQSVMFDEDTLTVAYDRKRGEPRGAGKRTTEQHKELGDCIDCTLCVQVCPTGIDIRDGLQIGCIGCAACIDACDTVMDKVGSPRGLVRYATGNTLNGQQQQIVRPRLIGYAVVLLVMIGSFVWTLGNRPALELDVLRDRNQLYRLTTGGKVENVYTLKLVNKTEQPASVRLEVTGVDRLEPFQPNLFQLDAGAVSQAVVRLVAPAGAIETGSEEIQFLLVPDNTGVKPATAESRFFAPTNQPSPEGSNDAS